MNECENRARIVLNGALRCPGMYARNPNELAAIVITLAGIVWDFTPARDAWMRITAPIRVGCAVEDLDPFGWDRAVELLGTLVKELDK